MTGSDFRGKKELREVEALAFEARRSCLIFCILYWHFIRVRLEKWVFGQERLG